MKNFRLKTVAALAGFIMSAAQAFTIETGLGQNTEGSISSMSLETTTTIQIEPLSLKATDMHIIKTLSNGDLASFVSVLDATPLISYDALSQQSRTGTFYSLQHPDWPPLPGNTIHADVWQMQDFYLLSDVDYDYAALKSSRMTMSTGVLGFDDVGDGGPEVPSTPPDISNYLKYMAQSFSVIDTNNAAANDTNLYNALLAFADETNTAPTLQIMPYKNNGLIFKASHFDYSGETTRDFALVVNDTVDCPLYKNFDLSNPTNNNQNGWLIQGAVPSWQVTDPMYLVVSNISRTYNAFFRVIPYGGPEIELTGPQPYDTVSNTVTLQAAITDLSGITNEQFEVTVDGFKARYSIGASNAINLETKYNPNGAVTIYANAANSARIFDPTNLPDNSKLYYSGTGTLPLDFENDTYLAFASDNASTNIGINYFLFVVDKAQDIDATISNPANGQTVAHYAGHVPYAATVELDWNFTESDGVTAYSNDTYVVTFTAYDPTTLIVTNTIDRHGVRTAAGNMLTYEEEDPSLSGGAYLNSQADTYVTSLSYSLYQSLYDDDWLTTTFYYSYQIGTNRDISSSWPAVLTHGSEAAWADQVLLSLTNANYSDFSYYMGHGNSHQIGGGPSGNNFINSYLDSTTTKQQVFSSTTSPNHRMRKVALYLSPVFMMESCSPTISLM